MEKKVGAILAIVIVAGIIGALIYTGVIPFFSLIVTSPTITVVDEKGNAVAGAYVKGVMTIDTFHWLGDVWNSKAGAPANVSGPDGVINNDDAAYESKLNGKTEKIDYFDMNGNGVVDIKDIGWVSIHNGTTISMTRCPNVTQTDGTCTISIYPLYRTDVPNYYLVTADKDGYHSGSALIDMRYGGIVTIDKNDPPVVDFKWSPTIPKVAQSVTFTASVYDPEGDQIISYSWTLTDGGKTKTFSGQSFSYSYTNYGDSVVTLTCTDSLGASNVPYPKTVHVDAGYVVVSISPSTTSGEIPLTVNFNGYAKDPDGGSIISYKWNFGDGSSPDYSNPTSHTYTSVGTFTVTLTATDSDGVSSSNTVTITTYSSPGYASLIITSPQPFAYVGEQVVLDGSGSKASSGATLNSFEWYIDGALQATTTYPTTTYTYPGFSSTGYHSAKLIVTDSSGNRFESSPVTINVVERPKADFTVSGTFEVSNSLTFTFTGKGSITSYSWDFGDGSTSTKGPTTTHSYSNPGTYTVRLTVSDGRTSDSIPKTVTISVVVQVDCLTLLEFPPSTNVKVKLYAHTPEGRALGGTPLTINIKSKGSYAGYTSGGTTYPNGTAFIDILTPPSSKDSPYNMTIYSQNQFIAWYELKVLPQLSVLISTSTSIEQIYVPGSYDFVCSGTVIDKETTEPVTGFGVYNIELKDEKGNVISSEYTNYGVQASTFTFKAKTFDYYFQKFREKYVEHTLTLKMTFRKTDPIQYIDASITVTVHMKPPYVQAVPESSSVTVGTDTFGFAFKDASGKPYSGLTASNIRITVIDPDGNQRSTDDPVNPIRYTWNDAKIYIAIAYTFDKLGTYKIVVEYSGLPFAQQPQTFPIQVSEAPSPVPSILTNPYVIAFIVLIIILVLIRRRRK